jgi:hypothetical protein
MRKLLTSFCAIITCLSIAVPAFSQQQLDTVVAGSPLPQAELIKAGHKRYVMLIYTNLTYKSIKILDRQVSTNGHQLTIVQKLYDGTSCNTDSVLVDKNTLAPVESYSTITSSVDSFAYHGNAVVGRMLPLPAGPARKVDTVLSKPLFNGLVYNETYQSLDYKKGVPILVGQYVPGHHASYERVEYVKDEEVTIAGIQVPSMVLNIQVSPTIFLQCWLSAKSHEILKMEGQFPGFTYSLIQI